MALYNKESKLADAIMAHPSLIPVVNRLGVSLGVGDKSIGAVCADRHIRADFFLSVINTFIDEEYFPVNAKDTFSLDSTINYLRQTALYYRRIQLPNIERHFNSLMERSGGNNNLHLLKKFFLDVKKQMEECLDYEEKYVINSQQYVDFKESIDSLIAGYAEVEEKLHDLNTFFVVHLQGEYDRNLCMAVVSAVFSLGKDLSQNNRIRNRILVPLLRA